MIVILKVDFLALFNGENMENMQWDIFSTHSKIVACHLENRKALPLV